MAGSVTVKDVAREANVSIGTVSRVFNNHKNVTEEIRQRVLEAASHLGYFGSAGQEARSSDSGRSLKEIGFLFCSRLPANFTVPANPFFSHILHGVEGEASKFNIKTTYRSISEIQYAPDTLLTTIYEMKLGGILLVGSAETETVRLIQSTKIPLVLVDNYVPNVNAVVGNNFDGAKAAVEYLISMGHRQIALIDGPHLEQQPAVNMIYTLEQRAKGYRMALLEAGLPVQDELRAAAGSLSAEGGYDACKTLLQRGVSFSAIFCVNDETAIGAMKALREAGRRIPEEVSLVGFDDIDMVEHLTPALTTVRVNKEAMGSIAFKRLVSQINNPDTVSVLSMLEVELMKRDSVMRYPAR
jgi:DNA-binding LacI/PurR family transcriptional regulator